MAAVSLDASADARQRISWLMVARKDPSQSGSFPSENQKYWADFLRVRATAEAAWGHSQMTGAQNFATVAAPC